MSSIEVYESPELQTIAMPNLFQPMVTSEVELSDIYSSYVDKLAQDFIIQ